MIVAAAIDDIPQLEVLVNRAYRGDSSRKGWTTEAELLDGLRINQAGLRELLTTPGSVILKYINADGLLEGCVNLQAQGDRLYLGLFSVEPEVQGKGIGKQLMMAAEAYAKTNRFHSIVMSVISVRTKLIDWYKKKGYVDTGQKAPFPPSHPDTGIPKQPLEFIILEK
ncbi:MAG: GNAT family N-acetyltransferase, partial [Chitinophagaceae bacterium]